MKVFDLNGTWEMRRTDGGTWIPAAVPGSMYSALLDAGQMDNPFYGENELTAVKLSEYDYSFRRTFSLSAAELAHAQILLHCDGLDTLAEIYLNDSLVAMTENMHRTYEFDVKELLHEGENEIQVVFRSPSRYTMAKQAEQPVLCPNHAIPGIPYLRKAHCMFGWDWGPKLPDMGIWRDIYLAAFDGARLDDVYITQTHADKKVELDIRIRPDQPAAGLTADIQITAPDGSASQISAPLDGAETHVPFTIENPQIWWTHNLGAQPLYQVTVALLQNGTVLDTAAYTIGLRTVTVRREKDQWGESFEVVLNGIPVFLMGANYIPMDNLLSRCTKERAEKLIQNCVAVNYNAIRVWGGGYYPDDFFYDLCDQYGILVWQDLMYACCAYDMTEDFSANIAQETVDNMKRLRHHPSLALWCGNNEQEWAWADWTWDVQTPLKYRADYTKQFEVLLPEIAKTVDPNTFYWLASPPSGGGFDKPNDPNYGDTHYWEVGLEGKPFTEYRTLIPRFMSEFGLQSFPCLKTVKTYTAPEDRNIFSAVMELHQKHHAGITAMVHYIGDNFKYPKDFDSVLYVSQLVQADGIRHGAEHWRRHRGRCMGIIYWQVNDCWPVASWSSIDYYGRWKALHYAARHFFAPVLLSACDEGTQVALHLSNETLQPVTGVLTWRLRDNASKVIKEGTAEVSMAAMQSGAVLSLDFAAELDSREKLRSAYLEYDFTDADGVLHKGADLLFVRAKHYTLPDPQLSVTVSEADDRFILTVSAAAYTKFVQLDFDAFDPVFSDNYFSVSAGSPVSVILPKADCPDGYTAADVEKDLKIRSLYDTFEK